MIVNIIAMSKNEKYIGHTLDIRTWGRSRRNRGIVRHMIITMDSKNLRRLERDLYKFADSAYPFATKATVNGAAFLARKKTQKNIGEEFVGRNQFTRNSIRVERSKTNQVHRQAAYVGSIADYFPSNEFGGTKRPKAGKGVAIPTSEASGEGRNATPRRRMPMKANKVQNIKLRDVKIRAKSKAQRNLIVIKMAKARKDKHAYIDANGRRSIVRVMGTKNNIKIKTVVDLTSRSVRIPAQPTLGPAVEATRKRIPTIYAKELRNQLRRRGLFRRR